MEFENNLKGNLQSSTISPKLLLQRLRVADERTRSTPDYQDPTYLPFYYHLGKYLTPKNILAFGFGLGFSLSCFLKTNKTAENILAFESKSKDYYSPRLGLSNVKDHFDGQINYYCGYFLDKPLQQPWDLIFFDYEASYDDLRNCLDFLWDTLVLDGYLVIEKTAASKKAVTDFLSTVNRPSVAFPTRYEITILKK